MYFRYHSVPCEIHDLQIFLRVAELKWIDDLSMRNTLRKSTGLWCGWDCGSKCLGKLRQALQIVQFWATVSCSWKDWVSKGKTTLILFPFPGEAGHVKSVPLGLTTSLLGSCLGPESWWICWEVYRNVLKKQRLSISSTSYQQGTHLLSFQLI
jgi:hypothetical protein